MRSERLMEPMGKEAEKVSPRTFGLIMIKPNAIDQVLHPILTATFEGDIQPVFNQQGCDFVKELDKVALCGRYSRDLSTVPYGGELINLFYGDLKDRRYFPMISDYYRGKVSFLLLGYSGEQEDFDQFLASVKGEAETYNEHGETVTTRRGVRGALQIPYQYYPREDSHNLDDEEYKRLFSPVVQNFIHVCDTPREVATAMTYLLTQHDFRDLERQGYPVTGFVKTHHEKPDLN